MSVLVCGEALYDCFVTEESASHFGLDARIGGSALNAAVGLARLGQPSALLTGIANDLLGDKLRDFLAAEGVDTSRLVRKDAPTTLAIVSLSGDGGARYTFYGEGAADRQVEVGDLPSLDGVDALVFGCFSILTKPTGDTFLTLCERAASASPVIVLDPNIRTTVVPDMDVWRDRVERFAANAHIIKMSEEDLVALYPGTTPQDIAARWFGTGTGVVAITEGGKGASLHWPGGSVETAAPQVTVVDTVAAGDTFLAGLITGLSERNLLDKGALASLGEAAAGDILRFAVAAAAITCTRRGADMPHRKDLPGGG